MEYNCYISSKYLVFQMKDLVFQSKYLVKPWISIEILGISNQKFWNTRFFTPWIWNTRYFENLEFRLSSRNQEDYYVPWLFLFVTNVWTVTKRQSPEFKKNAIDSNSNCDVLIINKYVMMILIILRITSIPLFTLSITSSTASVLCSLPSLGFYW